MISALYVDDESILLEIGKLYLERSGKIHIDTTGSVKEAMEKIRTTDYDVIISDYEMPEMNGIQFLKKIRSHSADLPFIIFTGRGREEVVIEALNCGADFYIQKGGDAKAQFAELIHKVERSVERKRTFDSIINLNRLYAISSNTNRAIIHIRDEQILLNEACRIGVEEGKFLMTWIGLVDAETRKVNPVAACGYEAGYLSNLSISVDNIPQGMGLTGIAIREKQTVFTNDIVSDPRMSKYRKEALKRGYRSSIAIPMQCNGDIIGSMRFYAATQNFFNDKEILLLEELVADIGFALGLIKKQNAGQIIMK